MQTVGQKYFVAQPVLHNTSCTTKVKVFSTQFKENEYCHFREPTPQIGNPCIAKGELHMELPLCYAPKSYEA